MWPGEVAALAALGLQHVASVVVVDDGSYLGALAFERVAAFDDCRDLGSSACLPRGVLKGDGVSLFHRAVLVGHCFSFVACSG